MAPPPSPWPRLHDSWWVYALAGVAVVVFPISLVVEVRCGLGRCSRLLRRAAVLPRRARRPAAPLHHRAVRRRRPCWRAWPPGVRPAGRGCGGRRWPGSAACWRLAKLVSAHSEAKGMSAVATLLVGVVLTVVALAALAVMRAAMGDRRGRRRGAGARPLRRRGPRSGRRHVGGGVAAGPRRRADPRRGDLRRGTRRGRWPRCSCWSRCAGTCRPAPGCCSRSWSPAELREREETPEAELSTPRSPG